MFDGFDPADLLGERGAAPSWLELDGADPINRGLMAFWPGGEAGGPVRDIGPYGLHASPGTAPSRRTTPRIGRAPSFNGSSQYLVTNNSSIAGSTAPHSVVAWVRPNFSSASNTLGNVIIRGAGSTYGQRLVWVNATVGWYSDNVSSGSGAAFQTGAATPAFSAGEWHLLEFTYNSGGLFYWDGALVATTGPLFGTWPNANLAGTPFYIGRDVTASQYWNGELGPIRQYTRPLTPGERRRILRDPWAGAVDPDARLYMPRRGAAAVTVSVSLTGISATLSAGTVTPGIGVSASGSAVTSAAGTPTSTIGSTLAGSAGTASAGTPTSAIGMSLTGEAMTVSAGSLAYTIGFTLTGVSSATAGGTISSSGGDTETERALTGISMSALPGNVRVTGGTRWVPQEARAATVATSAGNTMPPPPRLTGDAQTDIRAQQQYLQTFYDQFVKVNNVLGRINDHETRIAALEGDT